MWKRVVVPLTLLLTLTGSARADSPAMPTSYTKAAGEFVFVMLTNDGKPPVSSTGLLIHPRASTGTTGPSPRSGR